MCIFTISKLKAGGGVLGISPLPGRTGAYAGDLATLLGWAPDMVLSMTDADEMAGAGAGDMGHDLARARVSWHHLPIRDLGAPEEETLALWPEVSHEARGILGRGGKVLAHCAGGCGRSGMVLLRLMVELGEAPDVALPRLRAVRPCAVETTEQHAWAMSTDFSAKNQFSQPHNF